MAAGKDRMTGKRNQEGILAGATEAEGRALRQGQRSCREDGTLGNAEEGTG